MVVGKDYPDVVKQRRRQNRTCPGLANIPMESIDSRSESGIAAFAVGIERIRVDHSLGL